MKKKQIIMLAGLMLVILCIGTNGYAQEQAQQRPAAADAHDVEANNPLASIKSANLHMYYMSSLYGMPDATMTQTMIRYAQPAGQMLFRATLPFATMAAPNTEPTSGLGDLNAFAIYKFKLKNPGMEVGVGPTVTFPTGDSNFGSEKWQAGVSAIAFFKSNPVVQVGTLLTWQASFAGSENKPDISMLTPQIFFMWQLGGGTYLRSTGIWSFNLENGDYNIPIGLGIGKVIKTKSTTFNIFMEPQYSVLAEGMGQSKLQYFVGFNTQFR